MVAHRFVRSDEFAADITQIKAGWRITHESHCV